MNEKIRRWLDLRKFTTIREAFDRRAHTPLVILALFICLLLTLFLAFSVSVTLIAIFFMLSSLGIAACIGILGYTYFRFAEEFAVLIDSFVARAIAARGLPNATSALPTQRLGVFERLAGAARVDVAFMASGEVLNHPISYFRMQVNYKPQSPQGYIKEYYAFQFVLPNHMPHVYLESKQHLTLPLSGMAAFRSVLQKNHELELQNELVTQYKALADVHDKYLSLPVMLPEMLKGTGVLAKKFDIELVDQYALFITDEIETGADLFFSEVDVALKLVHLIAKYAKDLQTTGHTLAVTPPVLLPTLPKL